MLTDLKTVIKELQEIASIGYFESNLVEGTWSGSDNLLELLGLNQGTVYKNKDLLNLIHPDDREEVVSYFYKCIESNTKYNCEYRCILPDGNKIVLITNAKIIRDDNKKPVKLIGIKQDITSVNNKESKLKVYKEIDKRKNEILGTVAHDLKSPLSSVMGMIEMLSESSVPDQTDLIKYIHEALNTANEIINGLIEIAELEEEGELLHSSVIDINKILTESVNHFMIRAQRKGIGIKTELCHEAVAKVDTVKFGRIIDNLILNAIKFTNSGGKIFVSSYRTAEGLNITVEDNGIGIDPEVIPELFNKFSKARREGTSGEKSTGLGLSIVKELVELHKGKINVESRINKGSKFTVTVPAL